MSDRINAVRLRIVIDREAARQSQSFLSQFFTQSQTQQTETLRRQVTFSRTIQAQESRESVRLAQFTAREIAKTEGIRQRETEKTAKVAARAEKDIQAAVLATEKAKTEATRRAILEARDEERVRKAAAPKPGAFAQGILSARFSLPGLSRSREMGGNILPLVGQTLRGGVPALAGLGVAGVAGAAAQQFGQGVDLAGQLERDLNVLQGATGATEADLKRLRQTARDLGADLTLPATSSNDAAQAMLELAKNGIALDNVMKAARPTLQLAAAANISAGDAAKYVAIELNAFELAGDKAAQIADLLAASSNQSSASIHDLALASKQAASTYHQAGFTVAQLTADVLQLAKAGIIGEDAGTSLKTAIQRLLSPTKQASEEMARLGVRVYDNSGKLISHREIIERVSKALQNKSEKQRNASLSVIFGTDAIRAANIVLSAGVEKNDALAKKIGEVGAAARIAGKQTEGWAGAMDRFNSALDSFKEKRGAALLGFLTSVVNDGAKTLNTVDGLFERLEKANNKDVRPSSLLGLLTRPWTAIRDTIDTANEQFQREQSSLGRLTQATSDHSLLIKTRDDLVAGRMNTYTAPGEANAAMERHGVAVPNGLASGSQYLSALQTAIIQSKIAIDELQKQVRTESKPAALKPVIKPKGGAGKGGSGEEPLTADDEKEIARLKRDTRRESYTTAQNALQNQVTTVMAGARDGTVSGKAAKAALATLSAKLIANAERQAGLLVEEAREGATGRPAAVAAALMKRAQTSAQHLIQTAAEEVHRFETELTKDIKARAKTEAADAKRRLTEAAKNRKDAIKALDDKTRDIAGADAARISAALDAGKRELAAKPDLNAAREYLKGRNAQILDADTSAAQTYGGEETTKRIAEAKKRFAARDAQIEDAITAETKRRYKERLDAVKEFLDAENDLLQERYSRAEKRGQSGAMGQIAGQIRDNEVGAASYQWYEGLINDDPRKVAESLLSIEKSVGRFTDRMDGIKDRWKTFFQGPDIQNPQEETARRKRVGRSDLDPYESIVGNGANEAFRNLLSGKTKGNDVKALGKKMAEEFKNAFADTLTDKLIRGPVKRAFDSLGDKLAGGLLKGGKGAAKDIGMAALQLYDATILLGGLGKRKQKNGIIGGVLGGITGAFFGNPLLGAEIGVGLGGSFAGGGYPQGGRRVRVGEFESEYAVFPTGTRIYNQKDAQTAGIAGGGVNVGGNLVHMEIGTIHDRADADRILTGVTDHLDDYLHRGTP